MVGRCARTSALIASSEGAVRKRWRRMESVGLDRMRVSSARAPLRKTSVSGSAKVSGCDIWKTLVSLTAYDSYGGEGRLARPHDTPPYTPSPTFVQFAALRGQFLGLSVDPARFTEVTGYTIQLHGCGSSHSEAMSEW